MTHDPPDRALWISPRSCVWRCAYAGYPGFHLVTKQEISTSLSLDRDRSEHSRQSPDPLFLPLSTPAETPQGNGTVKGTISRARGLTFYNLVKRAVVTMLLSTTISPVVADQCENNQTDRVLLLPQQRGQGLIHTVTQSSQASFLELFLLIYQV